MEYVHAFHFHLQLVARSLYPINKRINGTFNVILFDVSDIPTDTKVYKDTLSSNGCSQFHYLPIKDSCFDSQNAGNPDDRPFILWSMPIIVCHLNSDKMKI